MDPRALLDLIWRESAGTVEIPEKRFSTGTIIKNKGDSQLSPLLNAAMGAKWTKEKQCKSLTSKPINTQHAFWKDRFASLEAMFRELPEFCGWRRALAGGVGSKAALSWLMALLDPKDLLQVPLWVDDGERVESITRSQRLQSTKHCVVRPDWDCDWD